MADFKIERVTAPVSIPDHSPTKMPTHGGNMYDVT